MSPLAPARSARRALWRQALAALVAALAAGGCLGPGGSSDGLTPVRDPEARYDLELVGLRVRPPSGELWYVQQSGPRQIAFYSSPALEAGASVLSGAADAAHTLAAMALEVAVLEPGTEDPAELRAFVERWLQGGGGMRELPGSIVALDPTPKQRSRLVEAHVSMGELDGTPCVQFDALLEERGHPQYPERVLVTVIRDNRLVRHPLSSDPLFVLTGCSERFLADHRPEVLLLDRHAAEAADFMANVELVPPRGAR